MPTDQTIDFVVMFLVLGLLALALGSIALGWIVRQWDMLMSRRAGGSAQLEIDDDRALSRSETNTVNADTARRVAEKETALFHSGENTAIARLIVAGVVKLTEGVKEGTGKRSGDAYSKRTKEIQAIIKDIEDRYPQRTPEQEALRQQLRLEK